MKTWAMALGLVAALAQPAFAEKVKLEVKVVEASAQGNTVDPRVAHLQRDLAHALFNYKSYKLASEAAPVLNYKQTADTPLPNGKVLKSTPTEREKDGKIKMHFEVPGMVDETISMPNNGRHVIGAGTKDHGKPTESQVLVVITTSAQ